MSKTLSEQAVTNVAEIVRHGEKITLPENLSIADAIEVLKSRATYEQQTTVVRQEYSVLPLDGANALNEVLRAKYGWAQAVPTPGFFGSAPPQMLSVEVKPGVFNKVPWGRFELPNIDGMVQCDVSHKAGRYIFNLVASVKRKHEADITALFAAVGTYLKTGSIYMGNAVKIRFRDDDGDPLGMPEVELIDTRKIDPSGLIYAADVQAAVETNLFTPISRVHDCIANNISVKRGVLLGGTYGTGKTMAATVASRLAVDAGVTYLYVQRAAELAAGIEFAKQYQSPACVIFCEDIDRETSGERSVAMDDILNLLDGIDTKHQNIITVLTTNDLNAINPAMLRPGRLDAVIDVTPPDAAAVEKLLRLYGGESIPSSTKLTAAAKLLDGQIPAIIAEVVKRAKLVQLRLQPVGERVGTLSEEALTEAAATMNAQIKLLHDRSKKAPAADTLDTAFQRAMHAMLAKGPDAFA